MHYREQLHDHKHAVMQIEGKIFSGAPVSLTVTLEDEDSPNSAGVVVDCVRIAALLALSGCVQRSGDVCAALMKAPRIQGAEGRARLDLDCLLDELSQAVETDRS